MQKNKTDKKIIIQSLKKMIENKEIVSSYLKGEITLQQITKKGIKFAKPL